MRSTVEVLREIAGYGDRYYVWVLSEPAHRREELKSDSWASLRFWFDHAFYQGRTDAVSGIIEGRALNALESRLRTDPCEWDSALRNLDMDGWLSREKWEDEANPVQQALREQKVNKRYDRLLVLSSLAFAVETGHLSIVRWAVEEIEKGHLTRVHCRLDQLASVGDKIASFFLRDLVDLFELRRHVAPEDARLLQPVDVWVRRIVKRVGLAGDSATDDEVKRAIVEKCSDMNTDGIRFNQGAFYLGFRAADILLEQICGDAQAEN